MSDPWQGESGRRTPHVTVGVVDLRACEHVRGMAPPANDHETIVVEPDRLVPVTPLRHRGRLPERPPRRDPPLARSHRSAPLGAEAACHERVAAGKQGRGMLSSCERKSARLADRKIARIEDLDAVKLAPKST